MYLQCPIKSDKIGLANGLELPVAILLFLAVAALCMHCTLALIVQQMDSNGAIEQFIKYSYDLFALAVFTCALFCIKVLLLFRILITISWKLYVCAR